MYRFLSVLTLLLFTFVATGCFSHRVKEPAISLIDVNFSEVSVFETTLQARLRLENENSFPVTVIGGVHQIRLNDVSIGKGITSEVIEIPRYGSAESRVTVRLSNISMLSHLQKLIESEKFDYRIESVLTLEQEGRETEMEVTNQGHLGPSSFR